MKISYVTIFQKWLLIRISFEKYNIIIFLKDNLNLHHKIWNLSTQYVNSYNTKNVGTLGSAMCEAK